MSDCPTISFVLVCWLLTYKRNPRNICQGDWCKIATKTLVTEEDLGSKQLIVLFERNPGWIHGLFHWLCCLNATLVKSMIMLFQSDNGKCCTICRLGKLLTLRLDTNLFRFSSSRMMFCIRQVFTSMESSTMWPFWPLLRWEIENTNCCADSVKSVWHNLCWEYWE